MLLQFIVLWKTCYCWNTAHMTLSNNQSQLKCI
jgi:hypothetical protein